MREFLIALVLFGLAILALYFILPDCYPDSAGKCSLTKF